MFTVSIFENSVLYTDIAKKTIPETMVFQAWVLSWRPDLFDFDNDFNKKIEKSGLQGLQLSLENCRELIFQLNNVGLGVNEYSL
ncbi:MAG TPA: hypothetical protein VF433_02940 [Cellvibrio sp.]